MRIINGAIKNIINYIYPLKCIFCGSILDSDKEIEICQSCYEKINFLHLEESLPIKDFYSSYYCDGVFCLFDYTGFVRDAIIKYKFFDKESFYRVFGRLLAKKIKKYYEEEGFDAIVAVPLHKNRLKERGYNQSELIVNEISKLLKIKDVSKDFVRVKDTKKQSLLHREDRRVNITNAFEVIKEEEITLKKMLIIDDILTTGSTLEECAKVLKEAGARSVLSAVLASGRK